MTLSTYTRKATKFNQDDEDPDPNIEQLQRDLAVAEEQMENEERGRDNEGTDDNVEQVEERPSMERVVEQPTSHGMRLRENRTPKFQSYKHPDFDNVEFQMLQEEVLDDAAFQTFQHKEKHMHGAYKPQRKLQLTFEEIKEGSPYTIEKLAEASHKHVLTQYFAQHAFKKIGEPAEIAMLAEYAQLRDKRVYKDDVDQDAITDEDDRNALNPIDLVKLKHDGRVKGRSCVDGRPQREHIPKEQCASPTIANNSLMLIKSVAAKERRKVATADVAGAYLHMDMDDFVLVKFTGSALDLMCKVACRLLMIRFDSKIFSIATILRRNYCRR